MEIKFEIETIADVQALQQAIEESKLKHELFIKEVKIEDGQAEMELWTKSVSAIKTMSNLLFQLSNALK